MELKWSLFTKDIRPHPQLRVKIQQKIRRLEDHLEGLPEGVQLKVSLEKHQKKKWFRVALALKGSGGFAARVQKFGDDPITCCDQAVKTLVRDITKTAPAAAASEKREASGAAKSAVPAVPPAAAAGSKISLQAPPPA